MPVQYYKVAVHEDSVPVPVPVLRVPPAIPVLRIGEPEEEL